MGSAYFAEGRLRTEDDRDRAWPALALLGDPVAHSLSPRLHEAALRARGFDSSYEAIRVAPADLPGALAAATAAGVRGLNLTAPLKELALAQVSRATDECSALGATNTLASGPGGWIAHNTDARGLAMALERDPGTDLRRWLSHCLVLGAGGAARSALAALEALGAISMVVVARNPGRAVWAEELGARVVAPAEAPLEKATLVVNCTPLGLKPSDPAPVAPERIDPGAYLLDMTYGPRPSALRAGFRGRSQDGLAMLVAQAALAFSVWYGALPPVVEMAAAIGIDW